MLKWLKGVVATNDPEADSGKGGNDPASSSAALPPKPRRSSLLGAKPEELSDQAAAKSRRLSWPGKAALALKGNSERMMMLGGSRRKLLLSPGRSGMEGSGSGTFELDEQTNYRARVLSEQYDMDDSDKARSESKDSLGDLPTKKIWIPNPPSEPWCLCEIIAISKDRTRVTALLPKTGQVRNMMREDTRGFDESHLSPNTSDLGRLNDLNEASTLSVLEKRFLVDQIYTTIGDVLISVNPYQQLKDAFPFPFTSNEPHLFTLTRRAFENLNESHSILINGESGAGKTESAKHIMRFLSQSQKDSSPESAEVRRAVAQTTPLLEAFGNAKTKANHNSSRFGRYVQILFNERKEIAGSVIRHFLLESNRATGRPDHERNFHIFYQLCIGMDSKSKQALGVFSDPNKHAYLAGYTPETSTEDDELAKRFLETSAALESVGAAESQRRGIWSALALVLRLGDVVFDSSADGETCSVVSGLKEAAAILQVDEKVLEKALIMRVIETGRSREVTEIPLNPARARDSRDGLARALYSKVFDWIVERANLGTKAANGHKSYVAVLDMMGFEILPQNGFEQVLINFASETLQAVFNEAALLSEKRFYQEEGVDSSKLVLKDNSDLIKLFTQGLFPLMDDIAALGGTDEQLMAKFQEKNSQSQIFCLDPFEPQAKFLVKHFAGPVTYSVANFVEKNRGSFFNLLGRLIAQGKGFICEELMNRNNDVLARKQTVSKSFRDSVEQMMVQIRSTKCHFVRCVRPNSLCQPHIFDASQVNDQLLRLGVFEAVRLRREGFPVRVTFDELPLRYPSLLANPGQGSAREQCERVLIAGLGADSRGRKWQLGEKNHVFLASRAFIELDLEVRRRIAEEEARVSKLAREEQDKLAREQETRRLEEAKRRAEEEQRRKREEEERLRVLAEQEAQRKREEEAERKRLEQVRLEEARLRKEKEEIEAKKAEAERQARYKAAMRIQAVSRGRQQRKRFYVLVKAERARQAELARVAKEKQDSSTKIERERKAVVRIQKFVRGELVRHRFRVVRANTKQFKKALRKCETVLKSTVVVRVQVNDMVRAFDTIMGANGKVTGVARKASLEIGHSGQANHVTLSLNHRKRYSLLLTRGPWGASLLLVDPVTMEVKDEMIVVDAAKNSPTEAGRKKKSSLFNNIGKFKEEENTHKVRAVSTSTRDFVVAKHKDEWALTDLLGGAVAWVSLLREDARKIPTLVEALNTNFLYKDRITDNSGRVIVKQGKLFMKRISSDHKAHWDKRWFVLDEERLQIFKGESNPHPVAECAFDEFVEVRLCPKGEEVKPFAIELRRLDPSSGSHTPGFDDTNMRFYASTKGDCDAWLVAFGVAVDRAKKHAADERTQIGVAVAGADHPLIKEVMKEAPHGTGAMGTQKLVQANTGKKKKGFDAQAFKNAFKEADKVTLANWE